MACIDDHRPPLLAVFDPKQPFAFVLALEGVSTSAVAKIARLLAFRPHVGTSGFPWPGGGMKGAATRYSSTTSSVISHTRHVDDMAMGVL
ncbi:MAG: hypothetical protein ACLPKB_26415 [Xanthobacteraceae bacterium]